MKESIATTNTPADLAYLKAQMHGVELKNLKILDLISNPKDNQDVGVVSPGLNDSSLIPTGESLETGKIPSYVVFEQNLAQALSAGKEINKFVPQDKFESLVQEIKLALSNALRERSENKVDINASNEKTYSQVRKTFYKNLDTYLTETGITGNVAGKVKTQISQAVENAIESTVLETGNYHPYTRKDMVVETSPESKDSNEQNDQVLVRKEQKFTPEIGSRLHQLKNLVPENTPFKTLYKLVLATKEVEVNQVAGLLESINSISNLNTDKRQKGVNKDVVKHVQQSLLELLTHKVVPEQTEEDVEQTTMVVDLSKRLEYANQIIGIWAEVLTSPEIQSYHLFNIPYINQNLMKGLAVGEVPVSILTCPDYSGSYDENGVFNFDFKGLGSGQDGKLTEGVVSKKSFGVVKVWESAISKYCRANVTHSLPTWEFPVEGMPVAGLSKDEVEEILSRQLKLIELRYKSMGISANVELSKESVMSDEEFWSNTAESAAAILTKAYEDNNIADLLKNTLKKRMSLYTKWYPQNEGEQDVDYRKRLYHVVAKSLAEYLVAGKTLTDRGHLVIDSSSSVTNQIYSVMKIPVYHGTSNDSSSYAGD